MRSSTWIKGGALVGLLGGVWWGLQAAGVDVRTWTPERIRSSVLSFGVWAPGIYLLVYGQPLVPLPASVMTLSGGLAFGPVWGTVAAVSGATMRACNQFLVARMLGREAVASMLRGRVARFDERVGANGFKAVLAIRLIPGTPFDLQNYGLGFSRVRFGPYILATILGLIPHTAALVYLGDSLTDPGQLWKLALAVVLVVGLVLVGRAWRMRHQPS